MARLVAPLRARNFWLLPQALSELADLPATPSPAGRLRVALSQGSMSGRHFNVLICLINSCRCRLCALLRVICLDAAYLMDRKCPRLLLGTDPRRGALACPYFYFHQPLLLAFPLFFTQLNSFPLFFHPSNTFWHYLPLFSLSYLLILPLFLLSLSFSLCLSLRLPLRVPFPLAT